MTLGLFLFVGGLITISVGFYNYADDIYDADTIYGDSITYGGERFVAGSVALAVIVFGIACMVGGFRLMKSKE